MRYEVCYVHYCRSTRRGYASHAALFVYQGEAKRTAFHLNADLPDDETLGRFVVIPVDRTRKA